MINKAEEMKTRKEISSKESSNATVKVAQLVRSYVQKKALHLPHDYSAENALKSAYLVLQEVRDLSGKSVLETCSQSSIINALFDMVVQGLNPAKHQCYFIAYGQTLVCQRSYFGDMMLAKRVLPGIHIYYDVVYEGDDFVLSKRMGVATVVRHETRVENINNNKILAAYCGIVSAKGEDLGVTVMSWEEIEKSWSKSKLYKPGGGGSPHHEFPDQMALRTVIRRRLKPIINSSSDEVLMQSVLRQELDSADADIEEEIEGSANKLMLQVPVVPESEEPSAVVDEISEEQQVLGY